MPPRPRKSRKSAKAKGATTPVTEYSADLSFPVSYREQQRYVDLADIFLALDEKSSRRSNVIGIDSRAPRRSRKAA